jgi:DNA topoisomerase-1
MAKNLVIVESPAKGKTIEGFLGKDYTVKSSFGHIRDLAKKGLGINTEGNFEPTYEIDPDKINVVSELKKLAKNAETVWLATDEDREGEAISWHLYEALELAKKNTKRIVFHEITKKAINNAIENPRNIDINLVNAQQARRILDRLVGFELSPVLWKKIKPSLSAGRVQSAAVRLIVEREREYLDFQTSSSYRVTAIFESNGSSFKAELPKRFVTLNEAETFLNNCLNAQFKVENLEVKPAKRSPAAPFTTSTLQQEAARKLGFSVAQTMRLAQRLYESGKITYMRTDSVNLSQEAVNAAKSAIQKNYGDNYSFPRQYKTKSKGAQEAHEAIRPSYMEVNSAGEDNQERKLYELIWKRTIASQMADAQLEKTNVTISSNSLKENFVAQGEVIKFDGFLKVYLESTDDENNENDEGTLPLLKIGQDLKNKEILATERFSYPPSRYTEASLVKKLEELGIGRPSTYAPTISTVINRGYVVKEDRMGRTRNYNLLTLIGNKIVKEIKTENTGAEKSKLFPTDMGMVVNDFLVQHFDEIVDYNFTAKVEQEFDEIADGMQEWTKMIREFYGPFHKHVEVTTETSERASGERKLGIDPVSGKNIYVRIGRFGPLVQIGEASEEEKPRFASLRRDQRLESITLEEALDLFKLPRVIGVFEDKEMVAAIGRFGPYIRHSSSFYSIPKTDDPMTIEVDRAVEIILAKRKADSEKLIKKFDENPDVQILNGRWGPYLAIQKNNYKLPKDRVPADLSLEECYQIAKYDPANPPAEKKGWGSKKTTSKKEPVKKAARKSEGTKSPKASVKKASAKKASAKKQKPKKTTKKA